MQFRLCCLLLAISISWTSASAGGWKAGAAAVKITPEKPVVLLGYPDRAGPFTGVSLDLYAKALAVEDPAGHRAVIVTGDLVGFQAVNSTNPVCERLEKLTGLPRDRFIFNASHTHTGPVVSQHPQRAYNVGHCALDDAEAAEIVAYTKVLQDKLTNVCVEAHGKLAPAELSWAKGTVDFPMSRRMPTPNDGVIMANYPAGLTDHDAPVLRVNGIDGKPIAILFGAACHNVAAGGINEIHGDYAGVAQRELQAAYPGAVAMFMQGCGADANTVTMGSPTLAEKHGKALADEVKRVLTGDLKPITGALSTQFIKTDFALQQLSREQINAYLPLPSFQARQAKHMLEILDGGGELLKKYEAPISVWQIGDELTLVALPGEPVAEYVSLLRKSLGEKNLWVAGFNNDCFGYLPTASVIKEGGHEAIGITLWAWGQDLDRYVAFFAPEVQDVVVKTATDLAKKAGRKP